jgi:hypothetical protein
MENGRIVTTVAMLVLAACLGPPALVFADDLPGWALKKQTDDASYKYIVGRAIDLPNDAQAIETATRDAIARTIRDNFGVTAQVQSQSYETSTESTVVSRSTERSQAVQLRDFNLQDSFIKHGPRGYSAWVLYRHSRTAIQAEKHRLATLTGDAPVEFTEVGNATLTSKGQLEITTNPAGAAIYVDGEKVLGTTPLRLTGLLDVGKHSLQLEHPAFVTVSRDFIVAPNQKTSINELLVPATARISVHTVPVGASILIDGQYAGVSPTEDITVPAGKPVHIDYLHVDAERSSDEVRLAKDESKTIEKSLPLIPAAVQVIVAPVGTTVTIDGASALSGWHTVAPGSHSITADRSGYETESVSIELRGGERKVVKIAMTPLSEIRTHKEAYPWILGAGFGLVGASSNDPNDRSAGAIGVHIEKKVLRSIGIKADLNIYSDQAKAGDAPSKQSMNGSTLIAGLPVYLGREFFIGPAYGKLVKSFSCPASQSSSSCPAGYSVNQSLFGGQAGWQHFFFDDWGVQVDGGIYRSTSDGPAKGATAESFQLLLLYRF